MHGNETDTLRLLLFLREIGLIVRITVPPKIQQTQIPNGIRDCGENRYLASSISQQKQKPTWGQEV
jgi:hypothetical protein